MPLQFRIFTENSGYFEKSDPDVEAAFAKLDHIINLPRGKSRDNRTLPSLKKILHESPSFFPAYLHIAYFYLGRDNPQMALESSLRGVAAANKLLPENYDGLLEWHHPENHEYLSLLLTAALACVQMNKHQQAVEVVQQLLSKDPADGMQISHMLATEALRAGEIELAHAVSARNCETFPMLYYELALIHIMKGEWVQAATALRRGFVELPYFQELFAGINKPAMRVYYHPTRFHQPHAARIYIDMYGELWAKHIDGLMFMDWLYDHPEVTAERARIMLCREAMLWADGGDPAWLEEEHRRRMAEIDDELSEKIVRQRRLRDGQLIWPWRYEM